MNQVLQDLLSRCAKSWDYRQTHLATSIGQLWGGKNNSQEIYGGFVKAMQEKRTCSAARCAACCTAIWACLRAANCLSSIAACSWGCCTGFNPGFNPGLTPYCGCISVRPAGLPIGWTGLKAGFCLSANWVGIVWANDADTACIVAVDAGAGSCCGGASACTKNLIWLGSSQCCHLMQELTCVRDT